MTFVAAWRRSKSRAFDLASNSTSGEVVSLSLFGRPVEIYANANLSIYSAQKCNARCRFCVEELRPASRGTELALQKQIETDDALYFERLRAVLVELAPLDPSVSITGGEPSLDPRLPAILQTIAAHDLRKRTLTTNGSGLLEMRAGRRAIDWIAASGIQHLNISRAHVDAAANARLMRFDAAPSADALDEIVRTASAAAVRVRLSCVLLRGAIDSLAGIIAYLDFAARLGVENVIFRQLMQTDPATVAANAVVRYSDRARVPLEPLLDQLSADARFEFVRQVMGYYYYVEVWRYGEMDVVFEEADLAQLERVKRETPQVIHELVFHPNGQLASTWQPWDGILGPP